MTLDRLLTAAADAVPEREALAGTATRLTWAGYERATAEVAAGLRAAGVDHGDRVAVVRSKDVRSYVAVHGAIRAGAIAVPVDSMAPRQALHTVLRDAAVAAVVADPRAAARADVASFDWPELRTVVVDDLTDDGAPRRMSWDELTSHGATVPWSTNAADAAYVIYTSGSTGVPKGIVHTHASALAYAERTVAAHRLDADDRVAGMSPFHFDMSTLELYAAPLARAAVVVIDEATMKFPAELVARTAGERITVWYSVPSVFRQVVDRGGVDGADLDALRLVMFGGEVYPPAALAELAAALPSAVIENIYGPAEVNECTFHTVTPDDLRRDDPIPIGRPWAGADIRVVDDDGTDVEPGEPGNLWVSTPTVMAGYWRRPDLDERSMHTRDGLPPWYATGDVVRQRADGALVFLGRRDHQVKVRGIRVELEGVEAVLGSAPGVLHAVAGVTSAVDGGTQLVAAVVPQAGASPDPIELRRHCAARLAPAAVPRTIDSWADFPRTGTGKIDRRSVRERLAQEPSAAMSTSTPTNEENR